MVEGHRRRLGELTGEPTGVRRAGRRDNIYLFSSTEHVICRVVGRFEAEADLGGLECGTSDKLLSNLFGVSPVGFSELLPIRFLWF